MRTIKILPSFERSLKKLSPQAKEKIKQILERFNHFLVTGILSKGLGFKKINKDKYELRVDIRLRIIIKVEREVIYFVLVGTHNDIKKYLREFR